MKRFLIRSGITTFENVSAADILLSAFPSKDHAGNFIGNNNGNLLYAYSVMRALMKEDDFVMDSDHYLCESRRMSDEEIERVNNSYDCYILPLANAFRYKFRFSLARLTDFISRINIPVVVLGVGIGSKEEAEENKETIKEFVKAVLGKSPCLGVRGEHTRDFLVSLGFKAEEEITAIGCPSAYTFGPTIKVKDPDISQGKKITFNDNIRAKEQVHEFMMRTMAGRDNAWFLPQMINELKELYVGASIKDPADYDDCYPVSLEHEYFKEGHSRFFINIPTWMEFVSDAGLSIGSRMHGNVISVLSGTPSMFIVIDSRMQDMIEYHHYPHVFQKDIDESTTLEELVEKVDYSDFYAHQQQNFDHYLDFLKMNGVTSIYDDGEIPAKGEAPFDRKLREIEFKQGIVPATFCSQEEMFERWNAFFPKEESHINGMRKKIKQLRKKISK